MGGYLGTLTVVPAETGGHGVMIFEYGMRTMTSCTIVGGSKTGNFNSTVIA